MGDYLALCKEKRLQAIKRAGGIKKGDFVRKTADERWHKVVETWDWESCSIAESGYAFFDSFSCIHRSGAPWNLSEVRYIADETGSYGSKGEPPVPEKYLYAGPVKIIAWAYLFRKYAYSIGVKGQVGNFKNPKRNEEFALLTPQTFACLANQKIEGLTLTEARRVAIELQKFKTPAGWRICPDFEAMEVYSNTINLKDLEIW